MASAATNREASRDYLAGLLDTALVDGGYAQAVYNYQPGKIEKAPVIIVVSAGSARELMGMGNEKHDNTFRFLIKICVADADSSAGWTEQEVEDQLDLLEKEVQDVITDNRSPSQNGSVPWSHLYREEGMSEIIYVPDLDGLSYVVEMIPVIARVFDS